jgi:zinc D-Ala-D-Ala carboxypeptidase
MDVKAVQRQLLSIGFPIVVDGDWGPHSIAALKAFQLGWNPMPTDGYSWLTVDGQYGPLTARALALSVYTGGLCSAHFRWREFACKHCGEISVNRVLLQALEVIRTKYFPNGMNVVSGYRCRAHNVSIGGATNSQHIWGTACDIDPVMTLQQCKDLHLVSGIEYRKDGHVYHVDVRHAGAYNPYRNTVANPSIFEWA